MYVTVFIKFLMFFSFDLSREVFCVTEALIRETANKLISQFGS